MDNGRLIEIARENGPVTVIADAEGRYVYVNRSWEQITGLRREDVLGKKVRDVIKTTKIDTVLATKRSLVSDVFPMLSRGASGEASVFFGESPRLPGAMPWCGMYDPLFHDGELIGVIIHTYCSSIETAASIRRHIENLQSKIARYQLILEQKAKYNLDVFVGNSAKTREIKSLVTKCARSPSAVLIEGETGTGKEIIAHAVHYLSPRGDMPFVKTNCAAIPGDLFESELFGYEEGAFTGSRKGGMKGKFELADKSSIFLDEIHLLPLALQPKLLRVLQEKEVQRLGSKEALPVDVRLISSANTPLAKLAAEEAFRKDLYYRLNVVNIYIPPLRDRKDDIRPLICHLIDRINRDLGSDIAGVSQEAVDALCAYHWPGNVRELQNILERAANFVWAGELGAQHLRAVCGEIFAADDVSRRGAEPRDAPRMTAPAYFPNSAREALGSAAGSQARRKAELLEALNAVGWNCSRAAKLLGISRTTLYKRLRRLSPDELKKPRRE